MSIENYTNLLTFSGKCGIIMMKKYDYLKGAINECRN